MKRIVIALALVGSTFFMVGCDTGKNGEDLWFSDPRPQDLELPPKCFKITTDVFEGGKLDFGEDDTFTEIYCRD